MLKSGFLLQILFYLEHFFSNKLEKFDYAKGARLFFKDVLYKKQQGDLILPANARAVALAYLFFNKSMQK